MELDKSTHKAEENIRSAAVSSLHARSLRSGTRDAGDGTGDEEVEGSTTLRKEKNLDCPNRLQVV